MARYDHRHRIGGAGTADRPYGSWMTGRCGNIGVSLGMTLIDLHKASQHLAPESISQPEVQRQHEMSAFSYEVLR
jgi:hypothetical protein